MIGSVTGLLAGHMAAGVLFVTAILWRTNDLPSSFVRFCAASAAGAALLAALIGPPAARAGLLALAVAGALWYGLARAQSKAAPYAAALSALVGIGASIAMAAASSETPTAMAIAGSLSAGLLLGAVLVTMTLGHWYLVDTKLSIAPLRDGARYLWIAVAARWIVVGAVLAYGGFEVLQVARAADWILSTGGLFFLFRSLMGLIAPMLLAGLIWQTVKMRSTQSATGLLYVALILVLFGELVSQFLLVMTGYPL